MGLQAQQIVSLATQVAKCPGYTTQAGQLLNAILQELCMTYDFAAARQTYNFTFNVSSTDSLGYQPGCGPNLMPANFLRALKNEAFFNLYGTIYKLIGVEQEEFDAFVQSAGNQNYPEFFYVDVSQSPPAMYVWMPAAGPYQATVRYQAQMPDIANPQTSTAVPWFPNTNYLIRRLSGELMLLTDDDRAPAFLGDDDKATPQGAGVILRKFLIMQNDPLNTVKRVELDRRMFKGPTNLKNTKLVGW